MDESLNGGHSVGLIVRALAEAEVHEFDSRKSPNVFEFVVGLGKNDSFSNFFTTFSHSSLTTPATNADFSEL